MLRRLAKKQRKWNCFISKKFNFNKILSWWILSVVQLFGALRHNFSDFEFDFLD